MTITEAQAKLGALPAGASALILGATDTGKTTFALAAAAALAREGRSVAYIDCDLGQSEVGPPGTVGVALAAAGRTEPVRSGRDLDFLAAFFVGATTPARHGLETAAGACLLARAARARRPDLLLADTAGWVQGPAARQLARRLADLLPASVVLAFARGAELDPLLSAFRGLKVPELWRVAPDDAVVRKTPAVRATRRTARFAAALAGASEVTLSLDDVAFCGTDLGQGEALPYHSQQFLGQSLRVPVMHAARQIGGSLYIVVNGESWDTHGLSSIEGHFNTPRMTIVPAQKFARLLVGLIGDQGALLDIGLIARIDFERRTVTVLTPCRRPAAVAQIWCGVVRVRPDGTELSSLKPGEL